MLIYNSNENSSNIFNKKLKNVKNVGKAYKSVSKRKSIVIRAKTLERKSPKFNKTTKKKKLSKKNAQFLEGLGLAVKRN